MLNRIIRQLLLVTLGEERSGSCLGAVDYIFNHRLAAGFGGPLTGSPARLATFQELRQLFSFDAFVETGTFRGESTNFFASFGHPVYSSEVNPRYLGYARLRLRSLSNIHFFLGDSRHFLQQLINDSRVSKGGVFFYLDAHWQEDLPLREEVNLIFSHWSKPVVMVDDFEVPYDSGYQFDDYGEGKKLSLEYLESVAHLGFVPFFPSTPSAEEVGVKRGWVVLARDDESIHQLRSIAGLREWPQADSVGSRMLRAEKDIK